MTDVFKKRMKKHRQTLNWNSSNIRKLKNIEGFYVGEVKGLHERTSVVFNIQNGLINVNDMLLPPENKFDYSFNIFDSTYKGKGIKSYYKDCERYVCYILILLEAYENTLDGLVGES